MMFVDNNFFNNESTGRLSFAIGVAACFHLIVFSWATQTKSQDIISADLFSPPTNVSIRFLTPVKEKPKTVQKIQQVSEVKNKPIKKKVVPNKIAKSTPIKTTPKFLNNIEPAAATQQVVEPIVKLSAPPVQVKAVPKAIPVVNERNLKGRRIQPDYPKRALRMRQEGTVWLRVLISETGARQNITIHKPSQYALLNQAAIKAVKKWTFAPNIVNGQATKSWVEIPVEFKIQ